MKYEVNLELNRQYEEHCRYADHDGHQRKQYPDERSLLMNVNAKAHNASVDNVDEKDEKSHSRSRDYDGSDIQKRRQDKISSSHALVVPSLEKIKTDYRTHDHVRRIERRLKGESVTPVQVVVLGYIEIDADELQRELNEADHRERIEAHDVLTHKRLYGLLLTQKISKCQNLDAVEYEPQVVTDGIEQSFGIHYAYRVKDYYYQQIVVRRQDLNVAEFYDPQKKQEHYQHRHELGYSNGKSRDIKRENDVTRCSKDTEPDQGVNYGRPLVETRQCKIHIKDPSQVPEYSS